MINTMSVSPQEAAEVIDALYGLKRAVIMWGAPGIGKSSIVAAAARKRGVSMIDLRLSQLVSSDLIGLPFADMETRETSYLRPDFLPTSGAGYLFLDELTLGDEQTRAACYQLILDRKIGTTYTLPDGWMIVAASNRPEDNAVSAPLGTALNDRVIHLNVEANSEAWLTWALANGIHPAVCAYVRARPDRLVASSDALNGEDIILPSPRSWHAVSDVLHHLGTKKLGVIAEAAVCGLVGKAIGLEFIALAEEVQHLPDPQKLLLTRTTKQLHDLLPERFDTMTALCFSIAGVVSEKNVTDVFRIINNFEGHVVLSGDGEAIVRVGASEFAALAGTLVCERCEALQIDVFENAEFERYNASFQAIAA